MCTWSHVPAWLILLGAPCASYSATLLVPSEYPTIQAGIDAAVHGDTVLVACGTYYEHDINVRSGITLRSTSGSADCAVLNAEDKGRGFLCESVDDPTTIEGFTIIHGHPGSKGGGIRVANSSLRIQECEFSENDLGGIFCINSSPVLVNCIFSGNPRSGLWSEDSSIDLRDCGFADNAGGAIWCYGTSVTLDACTFFRNGEQSAFGGGIYLTSPATLRNCVFVDNAAGLGGAIHCRGSSAWMLMDCIFLRNSAGYRGGAIYSESAPPTIIGCTFSNNSCVGLGSSIHLSGDLDAILQNTIIAFGRWEDPISCASSALASLVCCDVYGNARGDWVGCISDQYGIDGNFSADPLFCDPDNGDLSLHVGSPCLRGQHPGGYDCGLIGALDEGCGVTAGTPATWGLVKTRFE